MATYNYDGFGPPKQRTLSSGVVESTRYDREGRILERQIVGPAARMELRFRWGEDLHPAAIERTDSAGVETGIFLPDGLGRLAAVGRTTGSLLAGVGDALVQRPQVEAWLTPTARVEAFQHDRNDNLTRVERSGAAVVPGIGGDDRYLSFGGPVASDAEGRPSGLPNGGALAYDALGRLLTAADPSGGLWRFRYDAFGNLAGWKGPSEGVAFQRAHGAIVFESSSSAGELAYLPGYQGGPEALVRLATGEATFNHYQLGTRLAWATDSQGSLVEQYRYDAFGTPSIASPSGAALTESSVGNRMLLGAQPWLPALGMYSQGQRWYRPEWGRFLTPDPAGYADGPNRFAYAGAHPLAYVDPSGLGRMGIDAGGGGGAVSIADIASALAPDFYSLTDFVQGVRDGGVPLPSVGPPNHRLLAYHLGIGTGAVLGLWFDDFLGKMSARFMLAAPACAGVVSCAIPVAGAAGMTATTVLGGYHSTRLVQGAGGAREALGQTLESKSARDLNLFSSGKANEVVPYGTRNSPLENHHGILDEWAQWHIPGYTERPANSPTVSLTREQHDATKGVFREWLELKTGKQVGGVVDWSKVTGEEIVELSERMFDAAGVPYVVRDAYYRTFAQIFFGN